MSTCLLQPDPPLVNHPDLSSTAFDLQTETSSRMIDAMLSILNTDTKPVRKSNKTLARIVKKIAARKALELEAARPSPDLNNLLNTINSSDPVNQYQFFTKTLSTLLDHRHITLAADVLDTIEHPLPVPAPELIEHLFSMVRLGRLSSGFSIFQNHDAYLRDLPGSLPVLAFFQLGLWRLNDAANTFSDPCFPENAAPVLQIARELLHCINGNEVNHSLLSNLKTRANLHEHARLHLGTLYRESGDHTSALDLLPPDSHSIFAQLNRAITLFQLGNTPEAGHVLSTCGLSPDIMNNSTPTSAQMQKISTRLATSYGPASTNPYFHFLTQLTVARLHFPLLPLHELLLLWHAEYASVWRTHPEGRLIPAPPLLMESST